MYSTQLTDYRDYDTDNLILQLPDRRFDNKIQRVRVMTHHLDGSRGDLILPTPRVLTFGLQEQVDPATQTVVGYQLPLILWNKSGPTEDEKAFIDTIDRITEACKHFVLENREELNRPDLDEHELSRLNPLYYKIEKGEVRKDRAPLLYTRLNLFRQDNGGFNIRTLFTDEATKEVIDPLRLINKRCFIQGAIRLESVIIGDRGRPRFQVKLFEAKVRILDAGFKSLLDPGQVFPKNTRGQLKNNSKPSQQQETQNHETTEI